MSTAETLRAALTLLRPRMGRFLQAVFFGAASLGSALALAALSAWLITRAWQMPPVLDLGVAVVAVRALGISRAIFGYCQRLASHDSALRSAGSMRERLYDRLARGPVDNAMRLRSGQLVTRLGGDVDQLSDLLVRAVLPIAVAGVLGVTAVAAVATISPTVAALLAACLAVAGIAAPWLAGRAVVSSERLAAQHRQERDIAAMTALEHADQLRVAGRLPAVIADVATRQTEWGRVEDAAARPAALAAAAQALAIGVAVVGATVAGISLSTVAAPTTVAVLMLLPLSAFEATGALPAAAVTLVRARLSAQRLTELVAPPRHTIAKQAKSAPPASQRLEARALVSGFSESTEIGPLDLNLPTGARIAVVGPSGAGKTALLMTLAGLLAPRNGVVELGGTSLDAMAEDELRSWVTYFADDAHVFATTVGDNLRVARGAATDGELMDALSRVGLSEWVRALSDGLRTILVGGADALSAGQRRRLLLARALLVSSPIIVLDEPTENLDAADSDAFLRALLSNEGDLFNASRTVVVASHQLPADLACLRLAITPEGRKNLSSSTFDPSERRVRQPV
ncbi:thiol reductant ABC exporter subunit CydC [Mycolicibacterium stellerae]|uniref:thiol reductant ABC exporter subunit CydC n=1 Tax=Mycolicibacterium stellerae TaxID=2358193 RepID=UPI000F0BD6AF|nr:thiol reductant ABC exporter subunit CydC [Mycolicibacterium stellerae]